MRKFLISVTIIGGSLMAVACKPPVTPADPAANSAIVENVVTPVENAAVPADNAAVTAAGNAGAAAGAEPESAGSNGGTGMKQP
jgi:hypothetical protein